MAYTTKEFVADEFVNVEFTATTKVTDAQVDRWIAEADQLIDSFVGTRYLVPVTGPISLVVVRSLSTMLVAHRVACKLQVKTPKLDPNQGGKTEDRVKTAIKILTNIVEGRQDLSDADKRLANDGIRSFNADNSIEQFYKRGVNQW